MENLINSNIKLNLGDLSICPAPLSKVRSRKECLARYQGGQMPYFVAPMDTVLDANNTQVFLDEGLNVCLPRGIKASGFKVLDNQKLFESVSLEEFTKVYCDYANKSITHWDVLIDIANGHMYDLWEACKTAKEIWGDQLTLMVGNIANPKAFHEFTEIGVDYIRLGIGGGCLDGETRVLMAEGYYKNIKDINIGEHVINRDGIPVKVINKIYSGIKNVKKVKTNNFYKDTIVTEDHQFLISDLSNYTQSTISSRGYKKCFNNQNVKWKPIGEFDKGNLLSPNKIEFKISENLDLDLQEYESDKSEFSIKKIKESYELGYIFGLFLGDGSSRCTSSFNKKKNYFSKIGNVHWHLNKTEENICKKLISALNQVFDINPSISYRKSVIVVNANKKALANLFNNFYNDKKEKHLPIKFLCKNKEYLKGIYDGLIDSDGNTDNGRLCLTNTSVHLIELFNIINHILYGYFPNNQENRKSIGNLENCNINSLKKSYSCKTLKNYNVRLTEKYYLSKLLNIENVDEAIETWDIEVDCPTHSFIANNNIVHNSVCTTTTHTGVHYPMASLIMECKAIANRYNRACKIIADGGISNTADINIALACGADFVMMGSIFNKTNEACGQPYVFKNIPITNGLIPVFKFLGIEVKRAYRGMSTVQVQKAWNKINLRPSEGIYKYQKVEFSLNELLKNIDHRLQTAMSYTGDFELETFVSGETELIQKTNDTYNRVNK